MRIANLEKTKKELDSKYPINVDYLVYDKENKIYDCEWFENEKYAKEHDIEIEFASGGYKCKTIQELKQYLAELYEGVNIFEY